MVSERNRKVACCIVGPYLTIKHLRLGPSQLLTEEDFYKLLPANKTHDDGFIRVRCVLGFTASIHLCLQNTGMIEVVSAPEETEEH